MSDNSNGYIAYIVIKFMLNKSSFWHSFLWRKQVPESDDSSELMAVTTVNVHIHFAFTFSIVEIQLQLLFVWCLGCTHRRTKTLDARAVIVPPGVTWFWGVVVDGWGCLGMDVPQIRVTSFLIRTESQQLEQQLYQLNPIPIHFSCPCLADGQSVLMNLHEKCLW